MYKIVSTISAFIRVFLFPNPFTKLFEIYLANTTFSTSAIILADMFNLFIGGAILCAICYPLVGIIYNRGEAPAVGSLLYGVLVLINSFLISWVSSWFNETNILIFVISFITIIIVEIGILFGIRSFKNDIFY